ncbi:hypothetical protein ACFTUC_17540 [Streptomyces sp. NPDC056944]|uniref:hypothetical protein n=1 Tax=Streptomyces sp. NPDC056944 TaxID=3345972 RepID=UPI0036361D90
MSVVKINPHNPTPHPAAYAEQGRTGLIFTGARGGQLHRNNFRRLRLRALKDTASATSIPDGECGT